MIFKTFDSNIDKWTAKIGVLGKSFNDFIEASNNRKIVIDDLFTINGVPLKDAKKQAGSFWSYLYSKKEDIKSLEIAVPELINQTKANEYIDIMKQIDSGTHDVYKTYQEWYDSLSDGENWIAKHGQETKGQIRNLEGVAQANQQARASAIAHNEAIKAQTLSAKAGKAALQALATVGNMIAMWAITKGIQFAVKGIDNFINSAEHCKERVDELMSSYQSALDAANNNAKTVEELASRYGELSKGVNNLGQNVSLTTDEYSEYNKIVNQIADMFPQLIQGYTDEDTAILSLKGNVEQLRDTYKEAQREAYNMLIISGKDSDGNDILKNANNILNGTRTHDSRLKQVAFIEEIEDALYDTEKLSVFYDSLADRSLLYTSWFQNLTGIYSDFKIQNLSADDISDIRKELDVAKKKYQAEINEATRNVRTMLNAYLVTDENYDQLDAEAKNIASILVNSIDEEIAASFKNDPNAINDYVLKVLEAVKNPDIHDSLIGLFSLDISEMPINEAKKIIDQYIRDIAKVLEEDECELKVRLGFDDVDTLASNYETVIRSAAEKYSGKPIIASPIGGEIFDPDYLNVRKELEKFAKENSINTQDEIAFWNQCIEESNALEEAIEKYLASPFVKGEPITPLSISETVDQINTRLKPALSSLQSIYQEIFSLDENTGEPIFTRLDEADITDKFKPVLDALRDLDEIDGINIDYSAYDDFVSVLIDTASEGEDVQKQFNKLAAYIINVSDCTDMSAESFNLLAESLAEMGVTNAHEVLNDILELQESLANESINVETAMSGEAEALRNLTFASEETAEHLMAYYVQKQIAENPISTLNDILQLENLCNALGVTGEMYETVIALKRALSAKESGAHSSDLDDSIEAYQKKLSELASGFGTYNFDFNGANTKSSSSSGQSASGSTPETFDWTTTAIDHVEKEIEALDEVANSAYSTFSQKNEALAQEISKVSEEIDLQQQAYTNYMNRAESVGLSDHYKNLVQNGSLVMEDITGEALQNQISEYQKWYDKAQDVSKAIKNLNTDMKDLYVSAYELQTGNLKERLDSDSITQKQYLDGLKEAYERFYADLEDFAEQYHEAALEYLAEEKNYLNSVAGAASSLLDTEIDKIQEDAESQEESIQKQIDLLEAKKKPLQDELNALEDKEKRENLIFNLQKAQYELARSENQRTKLLYKDGQMVYSSDPTAITDARKNVDDAKLEIQKQSIEDRINALDQEIDRYNDLIDRINHAADAQIDALEKIKRKWQEVTDQQEYVNNVTLLTGEFGTGAITKILTGNDDDLLERWKNNYINTLAGIDMESQGYIGDMTEQLASLYDIDLSSLQSQFQNVTSTISGVTNAFEKAASAVGIDSNAPTDRQDAEGEPASNTSLSDSVTKLGMISNETLPDITSNMEEIAQTASNASFEVSHVADAINNIPESKDVTISVHTVGNVSGGASSQISQAAFMEGNVYASGTRRAEKGLALVGEKKPEVIITNDKKALLAKEPTLLNMEGGETVFDGDATARMLKARGFRPVTPDEFPLLKAFSSYSPDEILQKFAPSLASPARSAASSAMQNANHAVNSSSINNGPSYTMSGDVHIHCPGVTKEEVAKQIGTELTNVFSGLSLKAYQRANITR